MPIVIRYTACQILPAQICILSPAEENDGEVRERSFHFTAPRVSLLYISTLDLCQEGEEKVCSSASHISLLLLRRS
jgi:hypothetical protein